MRPWPLRAVAVFEPKPNSSEPNRTLQAWPLGGDEHIPFLGPISAPSSHPIPNPHFVQRSTREVYAYGEIPLPLELDRERCPFCTALPQFGSRRNLNPLNPLGRSLLSVRQRRTGTRDLFTRMEPASCSCPFPGGIPASLSLFFSLLTPTLPPWAGKWVQSPEPPSPRAEVLVQAHEGLSCSRLRWLRLSPPCPSSPWPQLAGALASLAGTQPHFPWAGAGLERGSMLLFLPPPLPPLCSLAVVVVCLVSSALLALALFPRRVPSP